MLFLLNKTKQSKLKQHKAKQSKGKKNTHKKNTKQSKKQKQKKQLKGFQKHINALSGLCVAPTALHILLRDHNVINVWLKYIFNKVPGHFKLVLSVCAAHFGTGRSVNVSKCSMALQRGYNKSCSAATKTGSLILRDKERVKNGCEKN